MGNDHTEYCKQWNKARVAKGICPQCGGPNPEKRFYCERCRVEAAARGKERYNAHRLAGLCGYCDSPALEGHSACSHHIEASRISDRKHYSAAKKRAYRNRPETKPKVKAVKARVRDKRLAFIHQVKLHYSCQNPNCPVAGTANPRCLDFHHLDKAAKVDNVSKIWDRSLARIITEINKCTVLCAYCHRLEIYGLLDATAFPPCKLNPDGSFAE